MKPTQGMKQGISSVPSKGSKNAQLVRDNQLVRSAYFLTAQEARFVYWLFWQYQETKQREHLTYIGELAEFCGVRGRGVYQTMYDMCYRLQGRVVVIWDEKEGAPSFINFTEKITPNLGEGTIKAVLHSELVGYLDKEVIGNQTINNLQQACRLKSFYSMRVYDLAVCHGFRANGFIYHVEELKAELGVLELQKKNKTEVKIKNDRYPEWIQFKQKVLERAVKEVGEVTDVEVKFLPIRSGRRVTAVQMVARKKGNDAAYSSLTNGEVRLVQQLEKVGMPVREARDNVKKWGGNDPSMITWHVRECRSKSKPLAWLRSGLKNDYRPRLAVNDKAEQLHDLKKRNIKRDGVRVHDGPKSMGDLLKGMKK